MGLITAVALSAIGAGGAVAGVPVVLGAIGFTSVGIAGGSYAAGWMSTLAIASGGGVAAGSWLSVLTSAGMAGLSTAVAGAGGTIGAVVGLVV